MAFDLHRFSIIVFLLALSSSSCATISEMFEPQEATHAPSLFGSSEEKAGQETESARVEKTDRKKGAQPSPDLELKLVKLTMRIEELEKELNRQKERTKLLEKAALLGLVPSELRSETSLAKKVEPKKEAPSPIEEESVKLSAVKLLEVRKHEPKGAQAKNSTDNKDSYKKQLEKAQELFNKGSYGQAITAYSDIGESFGDDITEGNHLYWIGLGWFYLKEFKFSEEAFQNLKARYPGNAWGQHAEYYIAKIELNRGFQQRALDRLQKILDENPNRDLGEMAQAEIERMKEGL